jgi:hypothetical protein
MAAPSVQRDGTLGPAVCTIVAKNYLAYARTLMKSLRLRHPDLALYVLFVDDVADFVDPRVEPFRCLGPRRPAACRARASSASATTSWSCRRR